MKYLFVLGRNPELSIAEVKSYLRRCGISAGSFARRGIGFLVETAEPIEADAIKFLGGVLRIGIVLGECSEIDKQEIYFGTGNKFNYAIWDFSDETGEVQEYLKNRFRNEKLRAREKMLTGRMNLQDGKFANIVGSRLIGEEFFVFGNFFGRIVQKCDYEELENRDMVKPVRREELAISPRLAKVMINFSEVKSGGKLADFFCGIGVILQEALLQELEVIGIDTDVRAIAGAKKNLEWFKFPKEKYQIINDDSRKVQIKGTDVMVSEPDLGEKLRVTIERKKKIILRKTYTQERAKERMQEFENLMIDVLGNVKKKISGRIVFTAPFIKSSDRTKERIGCNIARICERTKLKLASGFPIADFREGQITGRQIFVLER